VCGVAVQNNVVADRNVLGGGVPRIADRTISIRVTGRIAVVVTAEHQYGVLGGVTPYI
jgi:hypothetical protein